MSTIPLPNGQAHLQFDVELSGERLRIRFDWLTRYEYYVATIQRGDTKIAAGRGVHPDIDLLQGLNLDIGTLKLQGRAPTPDNLGVRNRLVHTP